ncbi:FecR family protein [Filimonas effusa]|uniref:FecR family protein n=1 Tax=Filimonas effusa TaxID=2508721 RepID=A0A4Q1D5J5_9BACT|nr:FecR domain-containing protein [Filimonas effusa]RXK83123.1 FecR family protein [Filimonas effusa]
MEQPVDVKDLLEKLGKGQCAPEEAGWLMEWLDEPGNCDVAIALLSDRMAAPVTAEMLSPERIANLERRRLEILSQPGKRAIAPVHRVHFLRRKWWAVAAVLAAAATGTWFLVNKPATTKLAEIHYKSDVPAGHAGALLTLADGKTVLLDSVTGEISNSQGASITKTGEGSLSYKSAALNSASVSYNTLSTPRARKFRMTLPDGSGVWLNAQSSIRFPAAFTGSQRKVEVTGEVYFEIVSDKNKPFIVKAQGQDINVLGTRFNVNTYADEPAVTTTLLEGSVQVSDGKRSVILHPGEQAAEFAVTHANIQQTMAWKDGKLYFESTDLKSIMRQISRWYDVDVVFEADAPSYDFTARLPDNLPVSEVLKLLEMTRLVHFEIEGKKIIVKK